MPNADVLMLATIIFAFVAFAVVLAWGEHQTRQLSASVRPNTTSGVKPRRLTRTNAPKSKTLTGVG